MEETQSNKNNDDNPLFAAWNNQLDLLKKIVTTKEIANQRAKDKTTALHLSSYQGLVDATNFLIEKGANIDGKDGQKRTGKTLITKYISKF